MTEYVYYVDGVNHTEATESEVHQIMLSQDGVLEGYGNELEVTQNTPVAMNVIVGTGKAWFNGVLYKNDAAKTVTAEAADATNPRIDTVIVRLTWATNTCVALILKGTAAASPSAPTLTQSDSVYEFPLMDITIPAGTTAITTAMLSTDRREYLYGTDIQIPIDGGGAVIATGSKMFFRAPFDGTIAGWEIVSSVSGSIVLDLKKCTYANFPTTASICASAKPTISSAYKGTSTTLTGWTTTLTRGEWYEVVVDSCTSVVLATLALRIQR